MRPVTLATEDELSEAIGQKLIEETHSDLTVAQRLRRGGFGYLRSRMRNFCELARLMPVLLITDLDAVECPMALMDEWLRRDVKPDDLLFRVAVHQVEAWLLADRNGIAGLLRIAVRHVPANPDLLSDAKRSLLELAQRAPRAVREELIAEQGAVASQGLGYNAVLSEFVRSRWDLPAAVRGSASLARAHARLGALAAV